MTVDRKRPGICTHSFIFGEVLNWDIEEGYLTEEKKNTGICRTVTQRQIWKEVVDHDHGVRQSTTWILCKNIWLREDLLLFDAIV